jgi:hypothetical protein
MMDSIRGKLYPILKGGLFIYDGQHKGKTMVKEVTTTTNTQDLAR